MDKATIAALVERLERLEREKRQLVGVGVAFVASALLLLAGATMMVRRPRVLEAERFVLKDRGGKARALLAMAPDGSPSLTLLDARGRDQVRLDGPSDGSASLSLCNKGEARIHMSASTGGGALLSLFDPRRRAGAGMYLWPEGTAGVALNSGDQGVQLAAQPDGLAGVVVADEEGKERGRMGALPEGVQFHGFIRADGKPPFRYPATGAVAGNPPAAAPRPEAGLLLPTIGTIDVTRGGPRGRPALVPTGRPGPQPL